MACPLPADEAQRLAALRHYQILDTPPEVEFDVTTRVAAHLFDTPIALVALMDAKRLWFKSRHGLDVAQLDRDIAFCAHAIMRPDELMVIDDLRADPRFADNPLVHGGPNLRFYAGAPLLDRAGHALGTIAVLGTEPRSFDAAQRALLRDLSVSVMTAIESRYRALELERLATTDHLTGSANRIQFEKALAQELEHASTAQPVSLLYLDLDGFKAVNDTLGHAAGDRLLSHAARRMQQQLRAGDLLARLGGDEFGIVMRAGADTAAATALALRIDESLRDPIVLDNGERVPIGVSIGIASAAAGVSAGTLMDQADHALYRAKAQLHQRWNVYGDELRAREQRRPVMPIAAVSGAGDEASGCGACAEGSAPPFPFSMAFQPIVDVVERRVFAYEALVRGPKGEPAGEVLGRVTLRNRYAFDQSCRRTAIELAARLGLVETGALLSINFIPGAMYEPENCVRATLAAARRANLPLDRLIFEVTEGEEVVEPAHLAKIFRVYREHGFRPAIDDFGAGYSGLNLLADFQPSILKLDRQLIHDIDASKPRRAIVRAVLGVCEDLGIVPIAEGVETEAEYRQLRALGLRLFQGYLFARPAFEAFPVPVYPD